MLWPRTTDTPLGNVPALRFRVSGSLPVSVSWTEKVSP